MEENIFLSVYKWFLPLELRNFSHGYFLELQYQGIEILNLKYHNH